MFSLNSATFTHFLQKQWEKDKHGKLWHLAKGCNLELSVCLYYIYNKWHLHSSLAFLYAHSFDSSIPGLQQSSNKQNNRYKSTQRDGIRWIWKWTWHLQLGASITSAALGIIYLALCWDPLAFHQKIQQTKRIPASCRWVRNSPEVSEWRFNSSESFTTFIKLNHIQEGMFRDVSKKVFQCTLHKEFSAAGCILVSKLQPHTVSQAGRGLKRFQAATPAWGTVICEITLWDWCRCSLQTSKRGDHTAASPNNLF